MSSKRLTTLLILSTTLTLGCGESSLEEAPAQESVDRCAEATAAIDVCYGKATALEFEAMCTPEQAEQVLPLDCTTPNNGKSDLIQDNWPCRNLGLLCDSVETFDDPVEHFKYGTLGAENPGMPVSILKALPEICPDLWPETGWAGWGQLLEGDRELPIGWSVRTAAGVSFAAGNCARCHTSTVRESEFSEPMVFFGGPGQQNDDMGMSGFLLRCLTDDRFTGDRVREILKARGDVGIVERNAIALLAGTIKSKALESKDSVMFMFEGDRTPGPGRSDAFNMGAIQLLGWDLTAPPHANADFGTAWLAQARPGDLVNWDGNSNNIHESNISVILTLGASEDKVDHEALDRVEDYLNTLEPPVYPFPINLALATQGAQIFEQECSSCHVRGGERFGTVIDAAEVGTDPERAKITTPELVEAMHEIGSGFDWQFTSFIPSTGYVALRLDGAWLRAPYLHNGSVPSLRELLSPPERRSRTFYRGGDVYDQENVGFVSIFPEQSSRKLHFFDTSIPGNSNQGHLYGTDLSDAEKEALIEYMKTL